MGVLYTLLSCHGSLNYILLYIFTITFSLVHVWHIKIKMFGYNWMPLEGLSRGILFPLLTVHPNLPVSPPPLAVPPPPSRVPRCTCWSLGPPLCQVIGLCSPRVFLASRSQASGRPPGQWLSSGCNRRFPQKLLISWNRPHSIPEEGRRRVYKMTSWVTITNDFPEELWLDTQPLPSIRV